MQTFYTAKSSRKMIFEKSRQSSLQKFRGVKNFIKITLSCTIVKINVFEFYTKIQDGRQKWQENNFWKKLPVDSADTIEIKNSIKITLSHPVSEINVFLCFTQKFKMATKNSRKTIFGKRHQLTLQELWG